MSTPRVRRRAERDTGFPEPFDLSTNTLPHPEADLSPDACITHDEDAGDLSTRRRRLPQLLHRKTRRNAKQGVIDQSELGSAISLSLPEAQPETYGALLPSLTRSSSTSFSSKETEAKEEGTPPTSPDSVRSSIKKNLFAKKWKR